MACQEQRMLRLFCEKKKKIAFLAAQMVLQLWYIVISPSLPQDNYSYFPNCPATDMTVKYKKMTPREHY